MIDATTRRRKGHGTMSLGGALAAQEASRGQPTYDDEYRQRGLRKSLSLAAEIQNAVDEGREGEAEKLRAEKENLQPFIRQMRQEVVAGHRRPRRMGDDAARRRDRVKKAVWRVVAEVVRGTNDPLADHFRTCIHFENGPVYSSDVRWTFT